MSDIFYGSRPWRHCRGSFLKYNPMCSITGCGQRSTQVDHIISRRRGGAEFDWSNLTGLCASHHSQKSVARDGGFGRAPNPDYVAEVKGCDADGLPTAPTHPWNVPS